MSSQTHAYRVLADKGPGIHRYDALGMVAMMHWASTEHAHALPLAMQ